MHRIIYNLIAFVCIFFFPWWVVLVLAIVGIFLFNNYYEAVIFGALLDATYSNATYLTLWSSIFHTLIFAGVFAVLHTVKRRMFMYHK